MRKWSALALLTLLVGAAAGPALAQGIQPVIDNERVTVWDTRNPLPPAEHDFVVVSLSRKGSAVFGHKGNIPGEAGSRTVVIELKDHGVAPIANNSGYPLAFPRPRARLSPRDCRRCDGHRFRPGIVLGHPAKHPATAPDGLVSGMRWHAFCRMLKISEEAV